MKKLSQYTKKELEAIINRYYEKWSSSSTFSKYDKIALQKYEDEYKKRI